MTPLRFMFCRCCGNRVLRNETQMCRQCNLAINREAYQASREAPSPKAPGPRSQPSE